LETELNIGMVTQFPLDVMHLVDLGVARKILYILLDRTFKFLTPKQIEELNLAYLAFTKFIPIDFNRKPRDVQLIIRWKATEFRLFLLYIGPILLKKYLDEDSYYHFLLLHVAIRILSEVNRPETVQLAKEMLEDFVGCYPTVYNMKFVNSNVHNLLHLVDSYKLYGPLYKWSNYKFENHLQLVKNDITSPNNILQQLYNRSEELRQFPSEEKKTTTKNEIIVNNFTFKINGKDNFCIVNLGTSCRILKILDFGKEQFTARQYLRLKNLYKAPLDSRKVNIFVTEEDNLSTKTETYKFHQIVTKVMRLEYEGKIILLGLINDN
jgi:hypothetical protein